MTSKSVQPAHDGPMVSFAAIRCRGSRAYARDDDGRS